ncbi:MAG TPA: TIGR03915 family putative DNA repair protein [Cyclobacteriaceae bacterium]|nr:TIGR03915 family putative DNA repair protein [Cyclobacteriaceae bacterium]
MVDYIFDGTFQGLLTAVFDSFERKHHPIRLLLQGQTTGLFGETFRVITDPEKAYRVWKGLEKKVRKGGQQNFYKAFLSEDPAIYQHLLDYARYIFTHGEGHAQNFGNEHILAISQMAQKVHREKHRMEAFVRFQKSNEGLFIALIQPDYNVLPLILTHFKNRYADQPWLIYDEKRKYGIHYDLTQVQEVKLHLIAPKDLTPTDSNIVLDEKESLYGMLWKSYFKSTNIAERKNMKLHLQHVPKRYWRYLTEKDVGLGGNVG